MRMAKLGTMHAKIVLICAMPLGLAAGYAWSAMTPTGVRQPAVRNAATIALPKSPEEQPALLDRAWLARSDDSPRPPATAAPADERETGAAIYYAGCDAVRAAGKAPLYAGQPGYRVEMDGDADGVACEPYRGR